MFFVGGVGAARAANNGSAPELIPFEINIIAGNNHGLAGGYGGDGQLAESPVLGATPSTVNGPAASGTDSVGNVYIADTSNDVIREINAQTGIITSIAGVPPSACTGTICTNHTTGCADGVPALLSPIGSKISGLAVDAYGNVYFDDNTSSTVSVIYRAGAQVAAFITLVDPGGVKKSGGVQPGYMYHVGGTINLSTCAATKSNTDNVLAFEDASNPGATPGAALNAPGQLSLDSAGNIYIEDAGNNSVRVINTQATTQTFFQTQVAPGFMRAIVNCSATLTVACPATSNPAYPGIGGPADVATYGQDEHGLGVDSYGNAYEINTSGATPAIFESVAFAGGAPLTNLLNLELTAGGGPALTMTTQTTPLYGDFYEAFGEYTQSNTVLSTVNEQTANCCEGTVYRPGSTNVDAWGNIWMDETQHWELMRVDANTQTVTSLVGTGNPRPKPSQGSGFGIGTSAPTAAAPIGCVFGSATYPYTTNGIAGGPVMGPATDDIAGDGCPAVLAAITSYGYVSVDGPGNIYLAEQTGGDLVNTDVRELPIGTVFPTTPVGTQAVLEPFGNPEWEQQALQVHFYGGTGTTTTPGSLPVTSGPAGALVTSAFSIAPGISDFTIDTTDTEFPLYSIFGKYGAFSDTPSGSKGGTQLPMVSGLPTCVQPGLSDAAPGGAFPDYSIDCLVYVTFKPTAPGLRRSQLVATTANGSVYNFPLTGIGLGGQLAIDGGQQTVVAATGLGTTAGVAVTSGGTVYIADPSNNRIVVEPAGGGTQTTIGTALTPITGVTPTTLSNPMGVALDAANNIYISDTGNNRVLEVNPVTGAGTVLGNNRWISGDSTTGNTPPPQYQFKGPQGLAVDNWGNVYVADTGNAVIAEITSNPALGGAVPLLQYTGAPTFTNPVAVAVDSIGNVYVADTGNPAGEVVEIPAGGGDLQTVLGPNSPSLPLFGGQGISNPNGVAVDAAGDVYVSDSGTNTVWEAPAHQAGSVIPFTLGFTGLHSPAGLALDANGNLYVADSGNKQILFDNRQNPIVSFGTVPQDLAGPSGVAGTPAGCPVNGSSSLCTGVLTVTNIGNEPMTLTSPFLAVSGVSPAGDTAYNVTNTCTTSPMPAGTTCTISPTFTPTSDGSQSETVTVNGTQSIGLVASTTGTGEQPLPKIVLSSSAGLTPAAGTATTITATVTQPYAGSGNIPSGNIPTGTVTFTYALDNGTANATLCGTAPTVAPVTLVGGIATFSIPSLGAGLQYTINAAYSGDTYSSFALAPTPLVVTVPGVTETVTDTSLIYTYGVVPVVPAGTLSPALPTGVTATFTSAASQYSNIGTYPITVVFSGGTFCSYGSPLVNLAAGGPATVTENPATLTVVVPAFTVPYGAPDIDYAAQMVITGAVGGPTGDIKKLSATFTPANSSILNSSATPYIVVPTMTGKPIGNYTVKITNGTLTVTQAPTTIGIAAAKTSLLPTALSGATYGIGITTLVSQGKGTPSGTVSISDTFVPIIAAAPGTGPTIPACSIFFTGSTTSGSATVTGVSSSFGLAAGETITGPGIPSSATLAANGIGSFTLSANATATAAGVVLTSTAPAGTACTATTTLSLVTGYIVFTPTNTTPGTHYFGFAYNGDSNFQAVTTPATSNLLVDNADFTLTSNTSVVPVLPGIVPSGNGLATAVGQNSAYPGSAAISINAILGETGVINLYCQTQNPSYVSCSMTPASVTLPSAGTAQTSIVSVWTPSTLPLGFFNTSQIRTSSTRTVWAFLPVGILAFCVRRRRKLSKALWMLLAIATVSTWMSGCAGNRVDFYTPVPQGPQIVTVTGTGTSITPGVGVVTRSFVVPISIE
jgi:sugar lactone lactonase YvrE